MSSKSPGQFFAQKQQQLLNPGSGNGHFSSCCSSGEFHQHAHSHQPNATSPDGDSASLSVARTLSGLPDGSCGMSSRDSGYCVNTSDGASTCSSSTTDAPESEGGTLLVLEPKSLRSFTTNDEYLYAMKEDLADWFACLYKLDVTAESFFPLLETGVLLCKHANKVQDFSQQRREQGETLEMRSYFIRSVPQGNVPYRENVKPQTFQARDNVSNFIAWGKKLGIPEVLSFETDDLVLRKNEKNVILCLLEIARVGAKLGMLAPTLVQMEEEIDAELAGEEVKPKAQIKTCDMRSLDEMVRDLVGRCTCPVQFPMVKVGDGKYKIGDSRSLIFVRILRNHVMVRVGGGWDTLENYLNKHDPCQCNYRGHRSTSVGPGNTQKASASANQQRPVNSGRSVSSTDNASSNPRTSASSTNKVLSPRRMSQPAVVVAAASSSGSVAAIRNRSTSPKQPVRSKSPTLIISRHLQGSNKPSFSVSNNRSADNSSIANEGNTGGGGGNIKGTASNVSKSWSQSHGFPVRTPTRNGSKSPSPGPNNSRLRSPSPLNASASMSSPISHSRSQHAKQFARASSSSALLSGKSRNQAGNGGEVKVGTPRSIKRAAMNSKYETDEAEEEEEEEEEDYEYENDDVDDGVYDDENYRWREDVVNDPHLQFSCEDVEADSARYHQEYSLHGSVSFDDSCDGPQRSRSSLERVCESDASETGGEDKKSNMPMEKINTMTLTEFKSLLSTALTVPEEQQQQTKQSLKDRENPHGTTKPSSLTFTSHNGGGITSTASTPGASESNKQLNWDALRDKARLVRDSISSSVNSRKASLGSTGTGSPGIGRRSLPQSPDDDGLRNRVPYNDHGSRPKTPQSVRRNIAATPVSRPKTPTSAISRPKTPTSTARPKTPSSMNQSCSRTPSSLDRNTHQREEYKMARPKTPSQMKREAVAKVAGAISNWVESRNELDSAHSHRGRPKTPVSSHKFSVDDNDEDNDEIMGTLANNHVESLASSIRERPNTPSRIPKPCFTPRPVTPKRQDDTTFLSSSAKDPDQFRPTIPARPPQSLSLSQQNSYNSSYSSTATTPDTENLSRTPGGTNIPASKVITRSQYQPAQSAPSTPAGSAKDSRNVSSSSRSYKDMYISKRATTPTPSSSSIPRSQPSRCVTPGPREKWSLGERPSNCNSNINSNNNKSRISSYQNGATSTRRGSLSSEHVSSSVQLSDFVVTNEITFSDDEEINEMLKSAAMASAAEKQERKPRSASVDARRLVRQNAKQKDVVVISRNTKGRHNVQVSKQQSADSTNSDSLRSRGQGQRQAAVTPAGRFRSQTPDPSMFRRKLSTSKSVGGDDVDGKSGTKSINRTEAWVDSTLSDTKRKLPPRPKRANTLGGDIPVSELAPRPLEEVIAILPEQQGDLVDTEDLDAPAEDPEMYKKMEKLFEKYREMELRASVNEVPGGGKSGAKKVSNPSSSNRSVDASSKSTPSVASMKTSSGSVGSSSGRSSSHHPTTSSAHHNKISSVKSNSSVPSTTSGDSNTTSNRCSRASSVPKTFHNGPSASTSTALSTTPRNQNKSANLDNHSNDKTGNAKESHKDRTPSLKDIDAATAKDPTALISKIKEILRVRPRKDENGKIPTRIPAPASLSKNRRSKSVSNLLDQVAEMTAKDNNNTTSYNRSNSNSSQQYEQNARRSATPELNKTNSTSSTNISYSEYVFSDKGEEADSVSDFTRTWSVQSDSSDSNNRCETPVPKLAMPLITGRSTFINRKLERSGRGLSNDKENALSNSQSSLSSRSALSTTEDEADYV